MKIAWFKSSVNGLEFQRYGTDETVEWDLQALLGGGVPPHIITNAQLRLAAIGALVIGYEMGENGALQALIGIGSNDYDGMPDFSKLDHDSFLVSVNAFHAEPLVKAGIPTAPIAMRMVRDLLPGYIPDETKDEIPGMIAITFRNADLTAIVAKVATGHRVESVGQA